MNDWTFLEELYKDTPLIIKPTVKMGSPNESIVFYEGNFVLKNQELEISVSGRLKFSWFPHCCAIFEGTTKDKFPHHMNTIYDLLVEGTILCQTRLSHFSNKSDMSALDIRGELNDDVILGDKTIPVESIKFSIPNLKKYIGNTVLTRNEEKISTSASRTVFESDALIITIDWVKDYQELEESLYSTSGYAILYGGEIKKKKGAITYTEGTEILHAFGIFLSFLNGRRVQPLFFHGICESEIIWQDFTERNFQSHKTVKAWPPKQSSQHLNEIWNNFYGIWKDPDGKMFLCNAVHWYTEANGSSGYVEGAIMVGQTALELMYNWMLIENKPILVGKDAENLSASNKIRMVLSRINVDFGVPAEYTDLLNFVNSSQEIVDAPEAIVQIRNAIVHSQLEKRKKLSAIEPMALYQSLQLSIWYIELAILYCLEYKGHYSSRCAPISNHLYPVPWIRNEN